MQIYSDIYSTKCNFTQFIYLWKLLYMFRMVSPTIIRSAYNCIYSMWYLSNRYCCLPQVWKSWNWFECGVGIVLICFGAVADATAPKQINNVGQMELVWVWCGDCIDLFCWRNRTKTDQYNPHTTFKPVPFLPHYWSVFGAVASATAPKQINTIPTPHSNQFQLFHTSGR